MKIAASFVAGEAKDTTKRGVNKAKWMIADAAESATDHADKTAAGPSNHLHHCEHY